MTKTLREPWGEIELEHLVYERDECFIVFIDSANDVDWRAEDEYIKTNQEKFDASLGVINEAANVETMPCENFSKKEALKFKRLIGEAIARALLFDITRAMEMIAYASEFNRSRNREISRYWQLLSCIISMLVLAVIATFVWVCREQVRVYMGGGFVLIILAFIAGTVGAFLSIASRIGSLSSESGASLSLHVTESFTRILSGGVSGIFGTVAIKSGLVLHNFTSDCGEIWNVLLVSLVAGLSERFVPSIITKFGLPAEAPVASSNNSLKGKK